MKSALQELYESFGPMIYRRCRTILRNDDEARDGVQEVFLKLAGSLRVLDTVASPTAYLYRMATNYSLNRLKRERRSALAPEEDLVDESPGHDELRVRSIFLDQLFGRVSARTRELAWYRWVDGLTWEQTALASGLSVSGVRKHLAQFTAFAKAFEES